MVDKWLRLNYHLCLSLSCQDQSRLGSMFMRDRVIFFDLGGVILDFDHGIWADKLSRLCGLSRQEVWDFVLGNIHFPFEQGVLSEQEFCDKAQTALGLTCSWVELEAIYSEIFTLRHDTEQLIWDLKASGIRMGLISNTNPFHWKYCYKTYPILKELATYTLSHEIKIAKPDAGIYLAAARSFGVEPDRCVFVDDLEANARGASDVGMAGIRFVSAKQVRRELVELGFSIPGDH